MGEGQAQSANEGRREGRYKRRAVWEELLNVWACVGPSHPSRHRTDTCSTSTLCAISIHIIYSFIHSRKKRSLGCPLYFLLLALQLTAALFVFSSLSYLLSLTLLFFFSRHLDKITRRMREDAPRVSTHRRMHVFLQKNCWRHMVKVKTESVNERKGKNRTFICFMKWNSSQAGGGGGEWHEEENLQKISSFRSFNVALFIKRKLYHVILKILSID